MTELELPANLPQYCTMCGERITVKHLATQGGSGQAAIECPACGHKSGISWSGVGREAGEEIPPGEWVSAGESWGPALKIDDEGDATYELLGQLPPRPPDPPEEIERRREFDRISKRFDEHGISALLEAAHFPIFAFVDLAPRLLARGISRGSRGPRMGEPRGPALTSVGFDYLGQSDVEPAEGLSLVNTDSETEPEALAGSGILDAHYARMQLMDVGIGMLQLPELREGYAIYRYVNHESFHAAEAVGSNVELRSGEQAEWTIRTLPGPVEFGYASTSIGRTLLRVGAVGPIAHELETILGELTRLDPWSEEASALDMAQRKGRQI